MDGSRNADLGGHMPRHHPTHQGPPHHQLHQRPYNGVPSSASTSSSPSSPPISTSTQPQYQSQQQPQYQSQQQPSRSIQACVSCRKSKLRCDGMLQSDSICTRCRKRGKPCNWSVQLPFTAAQNGNQQHAPATAPSTATSSSINRIGHVDHRGYPAGGSGTEAGANGHRSAHLDHDHASARSGPVATQFSHAYSNEPVHPSSEHHRLPPPAEAQGRHPAALPPIYPADKATYDGVSPRETLVGRKRDYEPDSFEHRPSARTRTSSSPWDHSESYHRHRSHSPPTYRQSDRRSASRSASPAASAPLINPAPLVALREVALLSPGDGNEGETDKTDGYSPSNESARRGSKTSVDEKGALKTDADNVSVSSTARAQQEASIVAEMEALQSQQGWTKSSLAEISSERRHFFERPFASEPSSLRALDPLDLGLITLEDAERYFGVYYEWINTQHCLLDPIQDSWQAVRNRSRVLFITIIAATACIDSHPTSRSNRVALAHNMDSAIEQVLMTNAKSPDVVKALLLAYLFTQKPDQVSGDRCWLLVDAAARTSAELGLGIRLRTPQASVIRTDTYAHRNAERAWIFSQVMQRSLSTSTGLWSTGKMDIKWDKLEAWCECRDALPGDVEHVAFLFLRRLEYHARSQFEEIDAERFSTLESIRASFNALFENWRRRWVEHPKLVQEHFSRSFLLIVGLHIQLLINVTALKLAEGSKRRRTSFSHDMPPDLHTYCAQLAIELCQQFIERFQKGAHVLCRNIVSMVTWSAMALLQMEPEKGRVLVLRVALMLAGDAQERESRTTLSSFFGRSLLSLVNDLAVGGHAHRRHHHSSTRHSRAHKHDSHVSKEQHGHTSFGAETSSTPQSQAATISPLTSGSPHVVMRPSRSASGIAGDDISAANPSPQNGLNYHHLPMMNGLQDNASGNGTSSAAKVASISAERMLSTMAGPLSADPFNEQWLNSFLDNLTPFAWPASNAPFENADDRQVMLGNNGSAMNNYKAGGDQRFSSSNNSLPSMMPAPALPPYHAGAGSAPGGGPMGLAQQRLVQ